MKRLCLLVLPLLFLSIALAEDNSTNSSASNLTELNQTLNETPALEKLVIEKFSPTSINIGENQINILLRNMGATNLTGLSAEITGDGITTLSKIPADIVAGDKDYVFTKINATKPGTIDVIFKIYAGEELKEKQIEQVIVLTSQENKTEQQFNLTEINAELKNLDKKYSDLESKYQDKKIKGYVVEIAYDKLKDASNYINSAKLSFFNEDYKTAENNIRLAEDSFQKIESDLEGAKKPETSLLDKIRSNILIIGSIAAAIVSIFTFYELLKTRISVDKIKGLQEKIKPKNGKKNEDELKEEQNPVDKTSEESEPEDNPEPAPKKDDEDSAV